MAEKTTKNKHAKEKEVDDEAEAADDDEVEFGYGNKTIF